MAGAVLSLGRAAIVRRLDVGSVKDIPVLAS